MLTQKSFSDIVTFTRASGGGRFNSSGVYEYVGNNVPRLDYDPVTLAPRGLLIEEQRTNLNSYSEQINSTNYNTTEFPVTLAENSTTSPTGLVNASLLSPTASSNIHAFFRSGNNTAFTSGASYTESVFAKYSGGRFLQLTFPSALFGASQHANFDLQTGTIGAAVGGTASIIPAGNGWYRCAFTATATSSGTASTFLLGLTPSAASGRFPVFVGTPANGIYIWGAQLEAGAFPTSYIPTTTAQVTRTSELAGVNQLSPWYRADEGTLFVDFVQPFNSNSKIFNAAEFNNGTQLVHWGHHGTAGNIGVANKRMKIAATFADDTIIRSVNGGAAINYPEARGPGEVTVLAIGTGRIYYPLNGHIRSIKYLPRRLSDAELQAITA